MLKTGIEPCPAREPHQQIDASRYILRSRLPDMSQYILKSKIACGPCVCAKTPSADASAAVSATTSCSPDAKPYTDSPKNDARARTTTLSGTKGDRRQPGATIARLSDMMNSATPATDIAASSVDAIDGSGIYADAHVDTSNEYAHFIKPTIE